MMNILKNKFTIVVIGRSGCGKGTQAKFVIKRLEQQGVRHLETGHFLREALKTSNPTTDIANEIMKKGGIFPWWFAAFTWLKAFIMDGVASDHIILDGAPRKLKEAELLDDVMGWHNRPLPLCIYIDVSYEESKNRLMARKRADDNPEAIHNRLAYFETDVIPVIRYYEDKGRMIKVNGEQDVEGVWKEMDNKLSERLEDAWPRQ